MYEQRQHPRYVLSSFVTWRCGEHSFAGQVVDISMGGMRIKSRHPMPLLGEIQFATLGSMPFEFAGQVKWISRVDRNFKFGVQFISLNKAQLIHIKENYLADLSLKT